MKRILIPIDFSDCSILAVEFAANMARKANGEIFLLHVLEGGFDIDIKDSGVGSWAGASNTTLTVPFMIRRLQRIKGKMHKLIKESKLYGLPVIDEIETGVPYSKIASAADKYKADIIIMGTHGVSGLKEVFAGSTAEKVVQHSRHPVISIKEKGNANPSRIVFASDFQEGTERIFGQVKEFAGIFNAEIHIVTVGHETAEQEKRMLNFLSQRKGNYPSSVRLEADTEAGILHFAKDVGADLIAIGTHGRAGLSRFFNPSISERLVNHSFLPVMTVNY